MEKAIYTEPIEIPSFDVFEIQQDEGLIYYYINFKPDELGESETLYQLYFDCNLEQINNQFNEGLQQQVDGIQPKGHTYLLGYPSFILQSVGIPVLSIELQASRLSDKSMQENHPFNLLEIKDLPKSVFNPLAIFRSATRLGRFVIMTELEHNEKNYIVALETNKRKGLIEINDIRSVHYRNSNAHIANWIEEELLEYVDKENMAKWFSKQRYDSAEVRKLFSHASKIVQNFENPKLR